jgi:predicted alpha/beta-hydrolase family hydrolase
MASSSPWMRAWAARLGAIGRVVAFDYPYMKEGRKRPDHADALIAAHRAELEALQRGSPGATTVLAGKSMGSRMGCHLANEPGVEVAALVCLGYPLVGQTGKVRDQVLLELRRPVLFVQGTRDELCPLPKLAAVRKKMKAASALHIVDGGDHSLLVTKTTLAERGATQDDVDREALGVIAAFLDAHAPT